MSYETSEILSVLVVASPGRQCLLSQIQQTSDIPRDKNLRDLSDCEGQTMILVYLLTTSVAHSGRIPYLQEGSKIQQNHVFHKWVRVCRSTMLTAVKEL